MKKISFTHKLTIFFIFIYLILCWFGFYLTKHLFSTNLTYFSRTQKEWLQVYSQSLIEDIKVGRESSIKRKIDFLIQRDFFTNIKIVSGGNTWNSKISSNICSTYNQWLVKILGGEEFYSIEVPLVDSNNTTWGFIKAVISNRKYLNQIGSDFATIVSVGVALFCIFLGLMLSLSNHLLLPLISLTKSVRERLTEDIPRTVDEIEQLKIVLERYQIEVEKKNLLAQERVKYESTLLLARQISHDVRSPLTALNMMLGQMTQLPEQQRIIMRSAITRINDIANDLLNKGKQIQKENTSQNILSSNINSEKIQLSSQLLSPLVDTIVSEKRIQFREKQDIEIVADIEKGYGLFANINTTELARVISNLLNNAIEAMPEAKGHIIVGIRGYTNFVSIIVQDNGKGIPQHILEKLGEQGVTHGKEGTLSGSGLGIYHAKKTIESFGGKFDIGSREGVGTTISLHFPKTQAPKWFVEKLLLRPHQQIISLDDDLSVHGIWKGRFESKKLYELGIEHLTFTSGEEFKKWFFNTKTANSKQLYLIDYELLNQKQKGLEIIDDLRIGSQSILVTSRYEEDKIQQKCEQLEVKLIPKAMACLVPIEIEKTKEKYDVCLLDDDFLTRDTWELVIQAQNKSMIYFSNSEDFFKKANELDLEIPIYIDSNLGNGIKGEEIAKKIFEMGFKNIWLCTGYQASDFPPMPWIKGIVGKDPPDNI